MDRAGWSEVKALRGEIRTFAHAKGDVALWERDAKWHAMSCTCQNLGAFDFANQAMDAVERWTNKRRGSTHNG